MQVSGGSASTHHDRMTKETSGALEKRPSRWNLRKRKQVRPRKWFNPILLHIGAPWFGKISSGEKSLEYRADSKYYRSRLLGKEPGTNVILQNGYAWDSPYLVCPLESVNRMPVSHLPKNLVPPVGSQEHKAIFKGLQYALAIKLKPWVERKATREGRIERRDP